MPSTAVWKRGISSIRPAFFAMPVILSSERILPCLQIRKLRIQNGGISVCAKAPGMNAGNRRGCPDFRCRAVGGAFAKPTGMSARPLEASSPFYRRFAESSPMPLGNQRHRREVAGRSEPLLIPLSACPIPRR